MATWDRPGCRHALRKIRGAAQFEAWGGENWVRNAGGGRYALRGLFVDWMCQSRSERNGQGVKNGASTRCWGWVEETE